ncbi:MAG: hypothetical protein R3B82_10505 [Sandaracinaceae bacterium]
MRIAGTMGVLVSLAAWGCGARTELGVLPPTVEDGGFDAGVDGGFDGGFDAGPIDAGCVDLRHERITTQVDVLFVIDDSGSMQEEQEALVAAFGDMAGALSSGDIDGDGTPEFASVADLHIGVVTTDMGMFAAGADGALLPRRCSPAGAWGNDGILRGGCGLSQPFVTYREGQSVERFSRDFACLARVGTEGCGFEMPLEAALKALTPTTSPIRFASDSLGHGDTDNRGFLRDESVLAIIVLTDEDDRSVGNTRFLEAVTDEERFTGTAWLHEVARYADGFAALREDPDRLVFAAIAGLPPDLAEGFDAETSLADPRMEVVFDPTDPVYIVPSCVAEGVGRATPPRRLVEVAGAFGDRGQVHSICSDDYRAPLALIAERVGEAITRTWCAD